MTEKAAMMPSPGMRLPRVVLFIEDDLAIRTLLCAMLHQWAGAARHCLTVGVDDDALVAITTGGNRFICVELVRIADALPLLGTGQVDIVV